MPKETRFSNQQLAEIFRHIADLLEIKGEIVYKTLAYRKAADSLEGLGRDAYEIWQGGKLTDIPGVGTAISEKIEELFTSGRLGFLEKLEKEVPPTLGELLQIPDLGPKKVALFWRELGITTLAELEEAAKSGKLRALPGMGEKSEARILAGIEAYSRRTKRIPLGRAWPYAQQLVAYLRQVEGVSRAEIAGSLRRMRATIGDIDLLVATTQADEVMEAFASHPDVEHVLSQGKMKTSVEFKNHLRAQLWAHSPQRFGTAWQYATGSKEHNIRLRELAQKQNLSLSDQAFVREDGSEIICEEEEEVYRTLGLPWIPPELREDRGEIQAALSGKLPQLVSLDEIRAELHTHTTWSDGKMSVLELAHAAKERGFRLLAITDHSSSLGVAGGLSPQDLHAQREEIAEAQKAMGDSLIILQGCEVEIRADGSLDFPDEVLAKLDIVIAALHSGLRQPRAQVMARLTKALQNPYVDILAHPTGRMIPNREGADVDMAQLIDLAAKHDVALEINAHPARLDLEDIHARMAIERGVKICINTDAHTESDLDMLQFGVATARRGWVTSRDVVNCWNAEEIQNWLRQRKEKR